MLAEKRILCVFAYCFEREREKWILNDSAANTKRNQSEWVKSLHENRRTKKDE